MLTALAAPSDAIAWFVQTLLTNSARTVITVAPIATATPAASVRSEERSTAPCVAGVSGSARRCATPRRTAQITAAHVVWQREDPEVIAEIAHVHHEQVNATLSGSSLAYYLQAAYRLPGLGRTWKPYYRFEHVDIDAADLVFAGVPNLDGSTIGVRYDISMYAAIKAEARLRRRADNQPRANGGFLQIAFTF